MKRSGWARFFRKYVAVTLGALSMGMGVSLFYVPGKVVSGGVSGISTILYYTMGMPVDLSIFFINLCLFIICGIVLGKQMFFGSLYGLAAVTAAIRLFSYFPPPTENTLLAALFGGVLFGAGVGVTFSMGASTGGTDIVGRLLQHWFQDAPIGKLMLAVDGSIVLVSFVTFRDTELLLCGILALVLSSFTIDLIIHKLNAAKTILVVSEEGQSVAAALVQNSRRGVTILEGKGAFSGNSKCLLVCAVKEPELLFFKETVMKNDSQAFIIVLESQKIFGNGFQVYQ